MNSPTATFVKGTSSTEEVDWTGALVININEIVPQEKLGTGTYHMLIFQSTMNALNKGEPQ